MDPGSVASEALAAYDADNDGAIAGGELDKCPGLKDGFALMDTNKDKRLSADEIEARVREYQSDKAGLLLLSVQVFLDGKPLTEAEVNVVPESFMGTAVKPAKGTTDAGGACTCRIEGSQYPGIHPGIYRIEVSKKNASGTETVPAKYNSETTLGIEARMGNPKLFNGLTLNLSSR
jgi:hypothetical protein